MSFAEMNRAAMGVKFGGPVTSGHEPANAPGYTPYNPGDKYGYGGGEYGAPTKTPGPILYEPVERVATQSFLSPECIALRNEWRSPIASMMFWRGLWTQFPASWAGGRGRIVEDIGFPLSLTYKQWASASRNAKLTTLSHVPSFGPDAVSYDDMIRRLDERCAIIGREMDAACGPRAPGAVGDLSEQSTNPPTSPLFMFLGGLVVGGLVMKWFG